MDLTTDPAADVRCGGYGHCASASAADYEDLTAPPAYANVDTQKTKSQRGVVTVSIMHRILIILSQSNLTTMHPEKVRALLHFSVATKQKFRHPWYISSPQSEVVEPSPASLAATNCHICFISSAVEKGFATAAFMPQAMICTRTPGFSRLTRPLALFTDLLHLFASRVCGHCYDGDVDVPQSDLSCTFESSHDGHFDV
jgi:hypothetical protein